MSYTVNRNSILSLIYNFHVCFVVFFKDLDQHFKIHSFDLHTFVLNNFQTFFLKKLNISQILRIFDILVITENMQILILIKLSLLQELKKQLLLTSNKDEIAQIFNDIKFKDLNIIELMMNFLCLL